MVLATCNHPLNMLGNAMLFPCDCSKYAGRDSRINGTIRNSVHDPPGPMKSSGINWYQINQKMSTWKKARGTWNTLYTLRYTPFPLKQPTPYLNPWRGIGTILAFGILLPSIEIVHEPSEPRDLCDCLRESASYVLLRVHKKELYIPFPPPSGTLQGQWVGGGGRKGTTVWRSLGRSGC